MDITNLCRVCLSNNNKMHVVTSSQLQEIYEKLSGAKLQSSNTTQMCYICISQLRGCARFSYIAQTSEKILTKLCNGDSFIETPQPVHNYSVTPVECVSIINDVLDDVKNEPLNVEQETKTKEEILQIKSEPEVDSFIDNTYSSDSEDDVPLNTLKTEPKVVKQKRKYEKRTKIDALEIYLTKEEQLQAMLSRASSHNYINSPYKCEICYKGFLHQTAYDNHAEKHHERSGPYECGICRLRYLTPKMLRAHTHSAHDRLYRCNKCEYLSHTAHQASDHDRWHDGHTYECQLCGQKFIRRTSYLTHTRVRHATEHICHTCGDRFVSRHGLVMHHNKTHGRKQVPQDSTEPSKRYCSECDIQFVTLDAWKKHILTSIKHTLKIEDSKECPICAKKIPEFTTLADHLKEHEKKLRKKPVKNKESVRVQIPCDQCGANFSYKSKLQAHIKRIHLGMKYNKNIVCEVCGKKCTSNASLKYHQRIHTGEKPYACSTCHKKFIDSNQLRIHSRTHTGERPYSCPHCASTFTQKPALNRHFRVHTGIKPYVCQFCSKSFSQSNSLKVHVRAVHEKIPYRRQKIDDKPAETV